MNSNYDMASSDNLTGNYGVRRTNTKPSFFRRFKWLIVLMVILIIGGGVAAGVMFGYVIPKKDSAISTTTNDQDDSLTPGSNGTDQKDEDEEFEMNDYSKPVLKGKVNSFLRFKTSDLKTKANEYSVPLNEKFPYSTKKIGGVNLGGWLVPEPFIVPSLFTSHSTNKSIIDEWTLCETLGKSKCQKILAKHYDDFVKESDIKKIADAGLNHIRIPIAHWHLDVAGNEPYVYGAWNYLLRGLGWARKYGLRVMVEFHTAPGSQNGWNHSGRLGDIGFLNPKDNNNESNIERFMKVLGEVTEYFLRPEWRDTVVQIGVLNEPNYPSTKNKDGIAKFYRDSYNKVRAQAKEKDGKGEGPTLVYHDTFIGVESWAEELPKEQFKNVALDAHNYVAFTPELYNFKSNELVAFPCKGWAKQFKDSSRSFGLTLTGEFSLAPNDCGLYLNGIGNGARYDGTFFDHAPACKSCSCDNFIDHSKFTSDYKKTLKAFLEAQMDAYESGSGWYFWNFKTENGVNPAWDYFLGLEQGWVPKDAGKRTTGCKDLV